MTSGRGWEGQGLGGCRGHLWLDSNVDQTLFFFCKLLLSLSLGKQTALVLIPESCSALFPDTNTIATVELCCSSIQLWLGSLLPSNFRTFHFIGPTSHCPSNCDSRWP